MDMVTIHKRLPEGGFTTRSVSERESAPLLKQGWTLEAPVPIAVDAPVADAPQPTREPDVPRRRGRPVRIRH